MLSLGNSVSSLMWLILVAEWITNILEKAIFLSMEQVDIC